MLLSLSRDLPARDSPGDSPGEAEIDEISASGATNSESECSLIDPMVFDLTLLFKGLPSSSAALKTLTLEDLRSLASVLVSEGRSGSVAVLGTLTEQTSAGLFRCGWCSPCGAKLALKRLHGTGGFCFTAASAAVPVVALVYGNPGCPMGRLDGRRGEQGDRGGQPQGTGSRRLPLRMRAIADRAGERMGERPGDRMSKCDGRGS